MRVERRRAALASFGVFGALAVGALVGPSEARAAGFALADQGAGASGIASAVTAREGFAASHVYNPAGVLEVDGLNDGEGGDEALRLRVNLGASLLMPQITHEAADGAKTSTEGGLTPVPFGSLSVARGRVGGGVYVAAPYGSSLTWPDGWAGRYEIKQTSLQVIEVGANVAVRVTDALPIVLAVGPRVQVASLDIMRDIDAVDPGRDAGVSIRTQDAGVGVQAGLRVRPLKALWLGAAFRSGVNHNLKGRATFRDIPPELSPSAHDSDVRANLSTPMRLALGGAYRFGTTGTLSLDAAYLRWSTFDQLVIDFVDPDLDDVIQPRRWTDTVELRLGYEHHITDTLDARVGLAYEPSPAPADTLSPSSPDSDRVALALGAGYRPLDLLHLNLAIGYTAITANTVSDPEAFQGTFSGRIVTVALGATLAF